MPTGLTKDAGWQIGVARTLPHSPEVVWSYLTSTAGLACWLGPGAELDPEPGTQYRTGAGTTGEVRSFRPGDRIRLTYGSSTVQLALTPASADRTHLRFHQERLSSANQREQQRTHWQQVMDRVAAALEAG
ncbi:SRPBCC domain-containing protein [Nocardia sp. NPDC024068]|uniref:SRPBCC family protein n=1 Tax=Nocardia sp. NPDC024068 TaxID=3157197 RepID=UPI0033C11939